MQAPVSLTSAGRGESGADGEMAVEPVSVRVNRLGGPHAAPPPAQRFCFSNPSTDPFAAAVLNTIATIAGQSRPTHSLIIPAALRHDTGTK